MLNLETRELNLDLNRYSTESLYASGQGRTDCMQSTAVTGAKPVPFLFIPTNGAPTDPAEVSSAPIDLSVVPLAALDMAATVENLRAQLEEERSRCRIAEHRAEHFFHQCRLAIRGGGVRVKPYIALYPRPTSEIMGRPALPCTAPSYARDQLCSICQIKFDATGFFGLGCGHLFHLYCITWQLAHRPRCPMCNYDVHVSAYRVLGMDDLYPGNVSMDPVTGRPVSLTTREDLMRFAAEEGYADIPEGIEDSVMTWEWMENEFEDGLMAQVLEESKKLAKERALMVGSCRSRAEKMTVDVERATRVEWEARVRADFCLWMLRQDRMKSLREMEAKRAFEILRKRQQLSTTLSSPISTPTASVIASAEPDIPHHHLTRRRRLQ